MILRDMGSIQCLVEELSIRVEKQFASEWLQHLVARVSDAAGEGRTAQLRVTFQIDDEVKPGVLPLIDITLRAHTGDEPCQRIMAVDLQCWARGAELVCVPRNQCPDCWQPWNFQQEHSVCQACGLQVGQSCLLVIEHELCPHCQEGQVTEDEPWCGECGYEVDDTRTIWT